MQTKTRRPFALETSSVVGVSLLLGSAMLVEVARAEEEVASSRALESTASVASEMHRLADVRARPPGELPRLTTTLPGDASPEFRELWWFRHLQELQIRDRDVPDLMKALGHWTPTHDVKAGGALLKSIRSKQWGAPDRNTLSCSGTLIGPYVFLTAAHCFEHEEDPADLRVFFQHEGLLKVKSLLLHKGVGPTYDLAIVQLLERRWTVAPMELTARGRKLNNELTMFSGFGAGEFQLSGITKTSRYFGIKKRGEGMAKDQSDEMICYVPPTGSAQPVPGSRDSGGPMTDHRVEELLGATHASTVDCDQNTAFVRLAHDDIQSWFSGKLGGGESKRKVFTEAAFSGCLTDNLQNYDCKGYGSTSVNSHYFTAPINARELLVTFNHGDKPSAPGEPPATRFDFRVYGPESSKYACDCTPLPAQFAECSCRGLVEGNWTIEISRVNGFGVYQLTALALESQSLCQRLRNWWQRSF